MKSIWKSTLIGIIMLFLCAVPAQAAHTSHPYCGKTCSCSTTHTNQSWTGWNGISSFNTSNVYLTQDAEWTNGPFSITGTVRICLNGHKLTFANGAQVPNGTTLMICDCVGGGSIDGADIDVYGYLYTWGGTLESDCYIYSGSTTYFNGGTMQRVIVEQGAKASIGKASNNKTVTITSAVENYGTLDIGKATVPSLGLYDSSVTEIGTGATAKKIIGYSGSSCYLSGSPAITSIDNSRGGLLYASNKNKTAYYEGNVITLEYKKGVIVQNVKDNAHAAYFKMSDSYPSRLSYSGTNLVCEGPVSTGVCGPQAKWACWADGTLEIYGSGDMYDYSNSSGHTRNWPTSATKVVVGDQITRIGSYAFYTNPNIKSVSFGGGTLELGDYCFGSCTALNDIDFGSAVVKPKQGVFYGCTALTSVHVPENVVIDGTYTSGYDMFQHCDNLETAVVDCDKVGPFMFESCEKLRTVTFTKRNVQFYSLHSNGSGYAFNTQNSQVMNVTLIGYTCSETNAMSQVWQNNAKLYFQAIAGDTTSHNLVNVDGVEPTCKSSGKTEGEKCSSCGYVTVKQEYLPVTNEHTWDAGVEKSAATCEDAGEKTFTCAVCQETKTEEIEALGHAYASEFTVDTPATCTIEGSKSRHCTRTGCDVRIDDTSIEKTAHSGGTATCIDQAVCDVCHTVYGETNPSNHVGDTELKNVVKATCTEAGYTGDTVCKSCNTVLQTGTTIQMLDHDWDAGTVTTPETCDATGVKTFSCTKCEATDTEEIPALGHAYASDFTVDTPATCTTEGSKSRHCTRTGCDARIDGTSIEKVGHNGGTATCVEQAVCDVCHTAYGETNPSNHVGDTELKNVVKATCTAAGYSGDTICKSCNVVIAKGKSTPAIGHTWDTWVVTQQPTVFATGLRTRKCKNCGIEDKNVLDKLPMNVTLPSAAAPGDPIRQDTSGLIGQSGEQLDKKMAATAADEVNGSIYQLLQLRNKVASPTGITIQWNYVKGATNYVVYGAKCGQKYTKIGTTASNSYTQNNLVKGTYYKYFVVAMKNGTVMTTSKTIHVATAGGKVGNYKSLKLNKKKVSIKVKKSVKLKATVKAMSKKMKVKKHRKVVFETSNPMIATVSSSGKVTGKAKGTCYVYAYAQDGVSASVAVTVK